MDFDFALMRLAEPLDFLERDNVRPICLPGASDSHPDIGAQVTKLDYYFIYWYVAAVLWFLQVIVSGWGTTKEYGEQSKVLQKVK